MAAVFTESVVKKAYVRHERPETETKLLSRLCREDYGQDLVEYALLAALIGLGSYGGFVLIQNTIYASYIGWDTGQQNLWEPRDPGAFGS